MQRGDDAVLAEISLGAVFVRRGAARAQAAQWGARPGLSGVSAQAQSARRGRAADMHQRGDWR
jgi:hypothetical protein